MITLYDARTESAIGTLTEEQLQELIDNLEEEWSGDKDYYIDQATVDVLQVAGVSEPVLALLRGGLAERGEADIRWSRA